MIMSKEIQLGLTTPCLIYTRMSQEIGHSKFIVTEARGWVRGISALQSNPSAGTY
mgnify:FL=1|jgi:hypothetical protein